jgi:hypothetical protein
MAVGDIVDPEFFGKAVPLSDTDALTNAELRASPVPVSGVISGAVNVSSPVSISGIVPVSISGTVPVSGTVSVIEPVSVDDNGGSLTVDGPLTDAQLRAAPVPVSGTVSTTGLTDAELRASPVPVSGTVSVTEPVSVDDNGGSLTVDGPLTDIELRATPVPVSGTVSVTEPVSVDDNGASLTVDTPQLPAALVGGRLDENVGAWLGSTAPTVGQKTMANSVPVTIASDQSTLPATLIPATTGGLTTFHLVSAATTNATNIKASAGQVFGWYIYNSSAAARKVAFHNTAGSPTAGASIFFTLVIPAGSAANVFTDTGIAFSTGIAITTVTGLADSDATAVAANDLIINIWYK